jgi:RHS repeat-associated protein
MYDGSVQYAPITYNFTAKERDPESGLDNFGARYDSSNLGRFMSPDNGAFHLDNPQSLNRYTYVLDNPMVYVDPDGDDSFSAIYHLGSGGWQPLSPLRGCRTLCDFQRVRVLTFPDLAVTAR